ncbi:MAG: enoyl-[acyl-carrier-protein] reductase FabK [Deltaproteobacteria bacterium]|nr:MAG: enoyl-[acyl-carrier-protein] reductase FabK [Deltaproteobacteria bacterium]
MIKTRVSELLGIEYPILKGGMVWVSNSRLTAAVSNAGGLGVMGIGAMDLDTFDKELRALKGMTDRPFGVSCPLIRPDYEVMLNAALERGVNIVVTSAGNPAKVNKMLLDAGVIAIHVVANVKMAKKVEDLGYHMLVAEGFEAGGHNGRDELTTFTLVPQVVDAVRIPVIAAGGIADARGMVAAFALGAEGIQMGTRFVATKESPVHENFKMAIINAGDTDTTITGRAFNDPTRVIKNDFTEKIIDAERKGVDPVKILEMIGSDRTYIGSVKGDMDNGSLMSGQVAGMIKELKSVEEVIKDIISGLAPVVNRISGTLVSRPDGGTD